jgi:hypothetical protein
VHKTHLLSSKPQHSQYLTLDLHGQTVTAPNSRENQPMKKFELTDTTSNVLVVSSVLLAMTPFLLGDQLGVIVTGFIKEASMMIDQFSDYLISLFS